MDLMGGMFTAPLTELINAGKLHDLLYFPAFYWFTSMLFGCAVQYGKAPVAPHASAAMIIIYSTTVNLGL
jgi:hypothetical protein